MIHQHLQRSAMVAPPVIAGVHLDEDALSAFVEGRLTETESSPVVQHLVGCAFCRRATAELIRLESETGPAETALPASEQEEPGRIRSLLDKLASRVLPQSEGDSVFAYHAPAEDFKPKTETTPGKEQGDDTTEGEEKQDEG
jgi:anti-sigma factor RsiW